MIPRKALVGAIGISLVACSVQDADPSAVAAVTSVDFTASTDLLVHRQTHITGQLTLGYTAAQLVQVRILDNGVAAWAGSMPASSLTLPVDQVIDLLSDGPNEITLEASYNGQSAEKKAVVAVPAPIASFALVPAASAVNQFQVDLSGTAAFGYLSPQPATLEISVEGASVYTANLDVSADPSAKIAATVPLLREGTNHIAATLRYSGQVLTQEATVTMAWDAPTLGPTTWSETYTPGTSLVESTSAAITAAPAYKIDGVSVSVAGGTPFPAGLNGSQASVDVTDPDIGDSVVAITVTTSSDAHVQQTTFYRPLHVDPKFDCKPASMLPSSTLVRNNRVEQRDLLGYWGSPAGGHTVSFVLSAKPQWQGNPTVQVVSKPTSYGRFLQGAEFGIDLYQCQNNPCSLSYDLSAVVDGKTVCSQAGFGTVWDY